MQVLITRTTVANKQFVREGSIVELDENEAKLLIAIGKAEQVVSVDDAAYETAVETEAEGDETESDEAEGDETEAEADELTTENAEAVAATAAPKGKRRGAK